MQLERPPSINAMAVRIDSLLPGWRVEAFAGLERPEWLALRRQDVTASELGCLFGDTRYLTPFGLYHRKLLGESDEENEMMKRGRVMEVAAAKLLTMEVPCLTLTAHEGSYLRLRTADPLVRVGATLDYAGAADMAQLRTALAVLGAKAPAEWTGRVSLACEMKAVAEHAYRDHWADGPPRQYVLQALTQAMLGGHDGAILAAIVGSSSFQVRLVVYCIRRDFDAELAIIEHARDFWEGFEAQRMPDVQAADNKALNTTYTARAEDSIDLAPEWHEISESVVADSDLIDALQQGVDLRKAQLQQLMGTASTAKLPGWTITWRQNAKARPLIWKRK